MPKEKEKKIFNLTGEEALKKFASLKTGLLKEEAEDRLSDYGYNLIKKKQNWKWLRIIGNQFNDALVWILLVAAVLAYMFSEFRDVTIILIIVFINAVIGFFQEWKAERILDGIKKLTTDKALVLRSGREIEIDAKEMVPGDIALLFSGDNVPADGYILESYEFKVNSVIFTGESKPRRKEPGVMTEEKIVFSDITNMVFMGEAVATGEAKFLVTATGMETELGRIANMAQEVRDDLTPMQKQMRSLGRNVTILSLFIGTVVIIAGQYFKMSLYQNFLFALALAVAVVPEGLPAAISVALSLGMKRLLGENVLAKKLNAVETLGSISIICTDKTGTITKNELTVVKAVVNGEELDIEGNGYEPSGKFLKNSIEISPGSIPNLELIFKIGTLCNSAVLAKGENGYKIIGDPTEGAIIVAGRKYSQREGYFEAGEEKITENPFSSERMKMSVVYKGKNIISYVKGSPDILINSCRFVKENNDIRPFFPGEKEKIRQSFNQMSSQALRVLAFAYRNLDNIAPKRKAVLGKVLTDEAEKDLVWVGMMAMIDPPRPDVGEAILECKTLGIKPIMITGDYEITAEAIAKNVKLIDGPGTYEIVSGKTLDVLEDKDIYKKIISRDIVFARITPEQKLRIASVLKNNGQIIAMTGDGVNDAPALKRADIGVAMGIMGTDVSKEASDMILLDDNFSSIVHGIKQGRTIFSNLKKFVHYVFTSNASELFTVVIGVLLQIPSPISAVQILAVDLGTDVFPSFSLSLEPEEPDAKKNANNSREGVISFKGFRRIIYMGIIMATGAALAFLWSMLRGGWHFGQSISIDSLLYIKSTTAAYAVLSMTQMANLLEARSEKLSVFKLGFFKNKYAIVAIFISVGMLLAFMHVPALQMYLHMSPIDGKDWLVVVLTTLAVFLWEEGRKAEENSV